MSLMRITAPRGVDRELIEKSRVDSVRFLQAHDFDPSDFVLHIRRAKDGRKVYAAVVEPEDGAPGRVVERWRNKPWLRREEAH